MYLDGTIELEMKLTGIVGISAHNEEIHNPEQDMKITEELVSPIHQHLFNVRIDWFLDGGKNKRSKLMQKEFQLEIKILMEHNSKRSQVI